MGGTRLKTLNGGTVVVSDEERAGLAGELRGTLVGPEDEGYEEARAIWNGMIDRRPELIVRCSGTADVIRALGFARRHDLLVSVRAGGHQIAGVALCDGGLTLDLRAMREVRVDPAERRAHVGPGATLADVDHETQAFGLAVPTGINSTTGIAGLTLGGGFGWLSRKHGLTVDNLLAADVVTAEGALIRADAENHVDLFWALRGGGGNFGVVTRFEFRLHRVGPDVLAGLVVYPHSQAAAAMRGYRDLVPALSGDTSVWLVLRKAPPLPFLPAESHGTDVVVFAMCHVGDEASGRKALEPFERLGDPLGIHVGVQPYTAWQQTFDPLLIPGARNYWKSHNFTELADGAIDTLVDHAATAPSPHSEVFVASLGEATARPTIDATAYPHRDARFVMNVHGRWDSPAEDEPGIAWSRRVFDAMTPFATGGVYINFMTEDEEQRVSAGFGPSLERLTGIKRRYDPENRFRMNQNVVPA